LKDKKLCLQAKKPFFLLEKSLSRRPKEKGGFEPEKPVVNKGQQEPARGLRPTGGEGGIPVHPSFRIPLRGPLLHSSFTARVFFIMPPAF